MPSSPDSSEVGRRAFLKGTAAGAVGLGLAGGLARHVFAEDEADASKMQMRVFGRTKRKVSVIGVGCGGLRPEKVGLLEAAARHGVNFIDTAWGYQKGRSEEAVGVFLAKHPDRASLFVNTKASGFKPPKGSDKAIYQAFKAKVVESLGRLQTEYVDSLMWPHGAATPAALQNEAMQNAFRKLQEEGLVRFFGTSSHSNYKATMEAAMTGGFYDVVLTVINVCTQNPDAAGKGGGRGMEDTRNVLKLAQEKDVAVMVMKAAKKGFLGTGTDALLAAEFPGESPLSRHQKLYTFAMKQAGVGTVVVGMTQALHAREAVQVGKA